MAISAGFKQTCPSCEALVPIKDGGMIGKKIDCPKCKYRFVVEDPVERDKKSVKGEKSEAIKEGKPKSNGSAKAPAKKKVEDEIEELEEVEDLDEPADLDEADDEKPAKKSDTKAKAKEKPASKKPSSRKVRDVEDDDEDEDKSPKKKKSGKKSPLGLILAGAGLVLLAIVAFMIFRSPGGATKPDGGAAPASDPATAQGEEKPEDPDADPGEKKPAAKKGGAKAAPIIASLGSGPGPELTNLLPNDTEHVFHVFFKDLLEGESDTFRRLAFETQGMFVDAVLQKRLGFSVLAIDDIIRAERFSGKNPWSFTVVHFSRPLDEQAVVDALALKPGQPTGKMPYYEATKPNPWLEQLGRTALGAPSYLRVLQPTAKRPMFVRVHNSQTLIFADREPMVAFVKADGQFRYQSERYVPPPPTADPNEPPPPDPPPAPEGDSEPADPAEQGVGGAKLGPAAAPGEPQGAGEGQEGKNDKPAMPRFVGLDTYMTVKPRLKEVLDRMEGKDNPKHRVLFSSATEMNSAKIDTSRIPEFRERIIWRPRLFWDITYMLQEKTPRIAYLGTSLLQRDQSGFGFRNELTCASDVDAKALTKQFKESTAPDLARVFQILLAHKVEVPKKDADMMVDPNNPIPPLDPGTGESPLPQDPNAPLLPADPQTSAISVAQSQKWVSFNIDLVFDGAAFARLYGVAELLASNLKNEADMAISVGGRASLAKAGKELGVQGLTDRGVVPGQYPPGTFKRASVGGLRTAHLPNHRISWMAGLLPFLGQDMLYRRIDFDSSWKDPSNWMVARTIVPEFLDPMYPDRARFVYYPDSGLEAAATHYVGLAGVGLDAADYDPADPAVAHKVGILGYNRSRTLDEVREGRGLSNTALMIQVPHDGTAGTAPWSAGGGATLRGIPEKNSIKPFVLTKDRNGKPIQHNGKSGTFVNMADGSVRFVDAKVSDEVFKAMVTVKGPAPEGFDLNQNEWTPLVSGGPETKAKAPAVKTKTEPKVSPPVKSPEKKDVTPEKKAG